MKIRSKHLLLIILLAILILIPPFLYIQNFSTFNISRSTTDWGAFGDFIGGITNTYISLLSLIILSYISWIISKSSTKENKNLYLLQKRLEAFDELSTFIPEVHLLVRSISFKIDSITQIISSAKAEDFEETKEKLLEVENIRNNFKTDILFIYKYHYFLFNFNVRFSHIFKYDFDSKDFNQLLESSKTYCESMEAAFLSSSQIDILNSNVQAKLNLHAKHLAEFINSLKRELE